MSGRTRSNPIGSWWQCKGRSHPSRTHPLTWLPGVGSLWQWVGSVYWLVSFPLIFHFSVLWPGSPANGWVGLGCQKRNLRRIRELQIWQDSPIPAGVPGGLPSFTSWSQEAVLETLGSHPSAQRDFRTVAESFLRRPSPPF